MVFGSEAPGAGAAIRPESGRTADDLVPEIADMSFLTTDQKVQIFNQNVLRVVPGMRAASVMPRTERRSMWRRWLNGKPSHSNASHRGC